jgi:hypothetical protein
MSTSSPQGEDGGADLVYTVKGRMRKPSAKALAAAESSSSSGIVQVSSSSSPSRSGSSGSRRMLSLQYAVAETVVNDDEVDPELHWVDARDEAITIEMVSVGEWRTKGFGKHIVAKISAPPSQSVKKQTPLMVPDNVVPVKPETVGVDGPPLSEGILSPKQMHADEPDLMDSHSEDSLSRQPHQISEIKRKRGRPFKGQEKPIEERLLIETTKIRRLIDDVIRKGDSSEFYMRLRQVVADLDSVINLMPQKDEQPPLPSSANAINFLHAPLPEPDEQQGPEPASIL